MVLATFQKFIVDVIFSRRFSVLGVLDMTASAISFSEMPE